MGMGLSIQEEEAAAPCEMSFLSNRRPELSRPQGSGPNSAWFKLEQPRGRARSELQIHIRSWFSSENNKTRGEECSHKNTISE